MIETYGGFTVLEDTVVLTSVTDVLDMATQELAKQAAETIKYIFARISVVYKALLNILESLSSLAIVPQPVV